MTVFEHKDYRRYLRAVLRSHPQLGRAVRPDRWATRLGYKSPRSLEMVLEGTRYPSTEMTCAFARDLKWTHLEKRYFATLVYRAKRKAKGFDVAPIDTELQQLNPQTINIKLLSEQAVKFTSEWFHLPIKQLVGAADFREDPTWIRQRLRGKVTEAQIRRAFATLLAVGILERKDGRLQPTHGGVLYSPHDVPSAATRSHHRQMMTRAQEALEEQAVSDREMLSLTFRMKKDRVPEFKKSLREVRDRLNRYFSADQGESVFQFNLQFFEHTE